jgi:hypothetical protein
LPLGRKRPRTRCGEVIIDRTKTYLKLAPGSLEPRQGARLQFNG